MKALAPTKRRAQQRQEYAAVMPPMLSVGDLIAAAAPVQGACGVYFLIRTKQQSAEVVYVGQSVNVHARVEQHLAEGIKSFDSWCYVECHKEQLDLLESMYVHWIRPHYNGRAGSRSLGAGDEFCAPIPRRALQHLLDALAPTVPWRKVA